jgi:hypothetical protein
MKTIATLFAVAALTLSAGAADAKGCLKGAVVGGVAGHYAGRHGVLGAPGVRRADARFEDRHCERSEAMIASWQSAPRNDVETHFRIPAAHRARGLQKSSAR